MKQKIYAVLLTAVVLATPLTLCAGTAPDSAAALSRAKTAYGQLPLSFEPAADASHFVAYSGNYAVSIGSSESYVRIAGAKKGEGRLLRFAFQNASSAGHVEPMDKLPGVSNYYFGSKANQQRVGVSNYARLRVASVYPGIDVVYYGDHRRLEFDFVVAAGADPSAIAMSFNGMDHLATDANGDLVAGIDGQDVRFAKPSAYQDLNGHRQPVEASYELAGNAVRLRLGQYDRSRELTIDPVITYATFLGGSAADTASGVAVDSSGNAYLVGQTCSVPGGGIVTVFPGGDFSGYTSTCDAYVYKYSADGTTLMFKTILGGKSSTGTVGASGVAVDSASTPSVYVIGTTNIQDLPNNVGFGSNVYQGGDSDAYIAVLDSTSGSVSRSTYLGGTGADTGYAIAVDHASPANVVAAGETCSWDFPSYASFEAKVEHCVAFVTELDNGLHVGSNRAGALTSGTPGYIDPTVSAFGPAPASSGSAKFYFSEFFNGQQTVGPDKTATWHQYTPYLQGTIIHDTSNPPNSQLALNTGCSGPSMPASTTTSLPLPNWSTTLYGETVDDPTYVPSGATANPNPTTCKTAITWYDLGPYTDAPVYHVTIAYGVAVDPVGDVYAVGGTDSDLSPYTQYKGSGAWILKVNGGQSAGNAGDPIFSTVLETNKSDATRTVDTARGVAVDSNGDAYVVGTVTGSLMGTGQGYQSTVGGNADAFLLKISADGSKIDYASYLGGSGNDQGLAVAVDKSFSAYVTGSTQSSGFPSYNALQNASTLTTMTLNGSQNAFITKFTPDGGSILFSTYLGGKLTDQGNAISVDTSNSNNIYVAGTSDSTDLETVLLGTASSYTPLQPAYGGGASDAFIVKIDGSSLPDNTPPMGAIQLSISTMDFGSQTVATYATKSVTVTNSSQTATLTSVSAQLSGASDYTISSNNCGTSLTKGASCTVVVKFLPTTTGTETASLNVTAVAGNSPQTVAITGIGASSGGGTGGGGSTGASFTVSSPDAAGVSALQGQSATYHLTFQSVGNFAATVTLSCSGPSGSHCQVSPSSVTLNGSNQPIANYYVYTNGGNGVTAQVMPRRQSFLLAMAAAPLFGMLLLPRRRSYLIGLGLLALCLVMGAASCSGGGSSSSSSSTSQLAVGTYQVTLTATANTTPAQTVTQNYPLAVQHQ